MPITRALKAAAREGGDPAGELKSVKALYVASRDGTTKAKIDLSNLAKIVDATLANKGIVQLQTVVDDNETNAATPKAVNSVKQVADQLTVKVTEIENSINEALPGEGSLAEKLKDVAFTSKDNQFTAAQTLLSNDSAGTDATSVTLKSQRYDSATNAFDAGATAIKTGVSLADKTGAVIAGTSFTVDAANRKAVLSVNSNDSQTHSISIETNAAGDATSVVARAPATPAEAAGLEIATAKFVKDQLQTVETILVDATDTQRGLTLLKDTPDAALDAATGKTAVTPKALFDTEAKITAVTNVVGVNAENAALVTKTNVFQQAQTLQSAKADTAETTGINAQSQHYNRTDGTFDDDTTTSNASFGLKDKTGQDVGGLAVGTNADATTVSISVPNADASTKGEIAVKYNKTAGTFVATAPKTPDEANGQEIVTADWAKEKIAAVQDSLVDATDSQRGLTLLSDAVNSELDAATGKTAASPKAVKTVNDALTAVTTVVGANAENAALKNAANTFTEDNTFNKSVILADNQGIKSTHTDFVAATGSATPGSVGIYYKDTAGLDLASVKIDAGNDTNAGRRGASLTVFDTTGAHLGAITVQTEDGTVPYATAPQPRAQAIDDEIATVKYVKDRVGDLDPNNVAYVNKENHFKVQQHLDLVDGGTNETSAIIGHSAHYDRTTAAFDNAFTSGEFNVTAQDKNSQVLGGLGVKTEVGATTTAISVQSKDGSKQGSVGVKYDLASDAFTATAPSTAASAAANEIATADFVNTKVTAAKDEVSGALQRVTNVIGQDAENAALVNKSNLFTQPQKIQQDGKILNLGGEGLGSEGAADDALVLGSSFDGSSAEIIIAANGSITRTELPEDPDDLEIATVGYVKSLGDISGSMETGNWSIAMQDFTNPLYQGAMDEGVFYSVPQNAADQYIQIDPETGRPAEVQADGTTDKKVDHFVIMYKAPTSKLVMNLGERKIAPDFNDVPLLSKDNTFTGTNVFKDAQKQTSSVDPQLGDVSANSYVTKTELVNYFTANAPWSNVVTVEPEAEDMVPGQIYFLVE